MHIFLECSTHLRLESDHDRVIRVDFEVLLGSHVAHGAESLSLHDAFHVSGPAVL